MTQLVLVAAKGSRVQDVFPVRLALEGVRIAAHIDLPPNCRLSNFAGEFGSRCILPLDMGR